MPAKETFPMWEAIVALCYGIIAVFVFAVLLAALGEVAFRWGDLTERVGETGAAILLGMTAVSLSIIAASLVHSLKK